MRGRSCVGRKPLACDHDTESPSLGSEAVRPTARPGAASTGVGACTTTAATRVGAFAAVLLGLVASATPVSAYDLAARDFSLLANRTHQAVDWAKTPAAPSTRAPVFKLDAGRGVYWVRVAPAPLVLPSPQYTASPDVLCAVAPAP